MDKKMFLSLLVLVKSVRILVKAVRACKGRESVQSLEDAFGAGMVLVKAAQVLVKSVLVLVKPVRVLLVSTREIDQSVFVKSIRVR